MSNEIWRGVAVLTGTDVLSGQAGQFTLEAIALNSGDPIDIKCEIAYRVGKEALFSEIVLDLWEDQLYDILDISLCLKEFAEADDLTITIVDSLSTRGYAHNAQTYISQFLLSMHLQMMSKGTPKFAGKRFIDFRFEMPRATSIGRNITSCRVETSPEDVRHFADQLRGIWDNFDRLMDEFSDKMGS